MMRIALAIVFVFATVSAWAQTRGIDTQLPPTATLNKSGNFHALLIGNAQYQDSAGVWKPLKTTHSGVDALAQTLRERYQFEQINVVKDGSRRDIILALSELNKQVKENDNVLVYYAGHGYLDEETNKGYWVPVDATGNDHSTFIRNSTVRDELEIIARRAQHTLLISDSCFAGSLLRETTRGINNIPADQLYYQKVDSKKSVQVVAAGGIEFVDDNYKQSGHSPFTYFLLNELQSNPQVQLSATELAHEVKKAVASNVEQTPQMGVLQGAGDELGEFIFVNVSVGVPIKTVPAQPIRPIVQPPAPKADDDQYFRQRIPVPVL
jgi:uncharacterized caspase-like protein